MIIITHGQSPSINTLHFLFRDTIELLVIEFAWTKKICSQLLGMKFHRGGNECYNKVNPEHLVVVH